MAKTPDDETVLTWIAGRHWCAPRDIAHLHGGTDTSAYRWAMIKMNYLHSRGLLRRRTDPDDARVSQYAIGATDQDVVPGKRSPCKSCQDHDGVGDMQKTIAQVEHWLHLAKRHTAEASRMASQDRLSVVTELAGRAQSSMVLAHGLLGQWFTRDNERRNPTKTVPESPK